MNTKTDQTRQLWARLFSSPGIDKFLDEDLSACELPSFSDYITQLVDDRNEKPGHIIAKADINESYGHRVFRGERNPSRDTVLMLAFGFELTPDETQQLLKVARCSALHPKVKRDAVVAYFLHSGSSLVEVQQALYDHQLPTLGGDKHV